LYFESQKELGVVAHACYPSYAGAIARRIAVLGWPTVKIQDSI
jgi:hypothetical protein